MRKILSTEKSPSARVIVAGIRSYLAILVQLASRGVLGQAAFYPLCGNDLFPATVVRVIGINIREVIPSSEFRTQVVQWGRDAGMQNSFPFSLFEPIDQNNTSVKTDIHRWDILVPLFQNQRGPKSILLKGFWEDACKREFNIDTERYDDQSTEVADQAALTWLSRALVHFSTGDHVIAFDQDIEWIRRTNPPQLTYLGEITEPVDPQQLYFSSSRSIQTYINLPARGAIYIVG